MSDLLDAALGYLGMGMAPLPAGRDKYPALKAWKEYQGRLPTSEEIRGWFTAEQHGVCLVCGAVSGNLARLDFDDPEDYGKLKLTLPESAPTFKSQRPGGGYGVLIRTPEPFPTLRQRTFGRFPKLEVRGRGAVTIVPPTPGYEWATQHREPPKIDLFGWLKDNAGWEPERRRRLAELAGVGQLAADRDAEFADLITGTEEGGRHDALTRLAGRLRWYGLGLEFAVALLTEHARRWPYTEKAFGDAEIRKDVESVYAYGEERPGLAERLEAEGYRIPTLSRLEAEAPDEVETLIEGLLQRGELLLMFAGAGIGKSTRTENLAAQSAAAMAVFGAFPTPRALRAFLWELENPKHEVVERMGMLRRLYPFGDNLGVDCFPGMDILDPAWQRRLRSGVEAFRPDVLIIEPLAAMHRKDENSSADMRLVLTPLRELAAEFGMGVVLCHHKGWGAEGSPHQRPRGSSAIMDMVDTAVEIEDMGELESRLTVRKRRSVSAMPVQELELRYDPDTHALSLADPNQLRSVEAMLAIAELRRRGWTLERIGGAAGTSKQVVSRWSRGEAVPSEELFHKLKRLFSSVVD